MQPLWQWKSNNYYSESVFAALATLYAKRMRRIILSNVAPLAALLYFSTLSYKQHQLKKNSDRTQNVCFDFLYNISMKRFPF